MFSLIITIISIALVAALAIATLYYGGSAFSQGSAKAVADTVVSQAQQITGANTLYANDNGGSYAGLMSSLTGGNYLAATPAIPVAASTNVYTLGTTQSDANGLTLTLNGNGASSVCLAIAKAAGNVAGSAATDPRSATSSTSQFDCYSNAFYFKG